MHHLGGLNANVVQTDWTLESSTCQLNMQRKSRNTTYSHMESKIPPSQSYSCVLQCAVHETKLAE